MSGTTPNESMISTRILRGTIANSAGQAIELGTGFLLTPFILYHLGATTFGLWALIGSLAAYGTLLDFGLTAAVMKYVAEFRARGEIQELRELISTAVAVYSIMGLVGFLTSIAVASFLIGLLDIPSELVRTARMLVILAGVNVGLSLPFMTAISILRGMHRFDLVNAVNIMGTLGVAGGIVAVLMLNYGVLGMMLVNIPVMIITQIAALIFIRRLAPELTIGWRFVSHRRAWSIFTYSSSISVQNISHHLQHKTDQFVIGAYMPVAAITPYVLAFRLGTLSFTLTRQFIKVLLPLASELHALADTSRMRDLFLTSTRLTIAMFLTVGCSVMVLAEPFLTFWVGQEYAAYAHITVIITIAGLFTIATWPAEKVLQGMARHRLLAITSISAGLANLGLSVFLVQRIGITGVAIGTLIPTSIGIFIVLPYTLRVLGIETHSAIKEVALPSLLPAIPALFALFSLTEILKADEILEIGLIGATGALVYLCGYLALGASRLEKQLYWAHAQRALSMVSGIIRRANPRVSR